MHACNPKTGKAETGRSEAQGYPWPHKFEANLESYMRFCSKKKKRMSERRGKEKADEMEKRKGGKKRSGKSISLRRKTGAGWGATEEGRS